MYFDPMGSFSSDMFGNIYRKIHKFLQDTDEYVKFKLNTNNVQEYFDEILNENVETAEE